MCATALQLRPGSTPIIPTPIGVSVIVLLLLISTWFDLLKTFLQCCMIHV
jgi:hypothetical protein